MFCCLNVNLFTINIFFRSVTPSTEQSSLSSSDREETEVESDSNQDVDESLKLFVRKKTPKVKKASSTKGGRKAMWSQSLLSDLVDIIISSEYYKKKLIFTNTKNQKNGEIYAQILVTLKERASERGEEVPFTNFNFAQSSRRQLHNAKRLL